MIRLICYDLENDKIRLKVSKLLIKKGYERLQKSVFMGECDTISWDLLQRQLENLILKDENAMHALHSIVIEENAVMGMYALGVIPDYEYICNKKKVIFF